MCAAWPALTELSEVACSEPVKAPGFEPVTFGSAPIRGS
jgi:hypothetical protein